MSVVILKVHRNGGAGQWRGWALLALLLLGCLVSVQHALGDSLPWIQIGQDIDGDASGDISGYSVALSADGSRMAIGAPQGVGPLVAHYAGYVRVYDLIGGAWVQVGQDIDGEEGGDWSGSSVALSADGSRVAIGAQYNNGNGYNYDAGHVRIYDLVSGVWVRVGQDIDGEAVGDHSGYSVALSADGSRVAIGAPFNAGNGSLAGQARVYDLVGETWVQVGQDIDGEAAGDYSGISVDLSAAGSLVAIGAPLNDGNGSEAGQVRVYNLVGETWMQVGQDIDGEAAGDWSGLSVALSTDGSRVAIGAPLNDGNGGFPGQVRVYGLVGGIWMQVGQDIDGEAAFDRSGFSVALSADGSRVAIGAPYNSGNGSDAGQVRVYDLVSGTWNQVGDDIDGEAADISGFSVALSAGGGRVAIGAPESGGLVGQARVYAWESLPTLHVGDLDAVTTDWGTRWRARVTVRVHDAFESPVRGVTVTLAIDGRTERRCVTGAAGACFISTGAPDSLASLTSIVVDLAKPGFAYDFDANHDPEGDSNGTMIVVNQP